MDNISKEQSLKPKDKSQERTPDNPPKRSASYEQLVGLGLDPEKYHAGSSEVDKGESQDTDVNRRVNLSNEFQQLGGNTSLESAKVIFLGNTHTHDRHTELNAQLINIVANDGDIVLLEGRKADQEYRQEKIDKTKLISKKVRVFGWDNEELNTKGADITRQALGIKNILNQRECSSEEYSNLSEKYENLIEQYFTGIIERNEGLIRVISDKKKDFPDSKIFILAGPYHFTEDTSFQNYLDTSQYIAFEPTYTLSVEESEKKTQQYYGV